MKKYLSIFLIFVVFFGVTTVGFAQIKTGGYKKIAVTDAGVVAAANFAAQTQSEKDNAEITVQTIEKAESQTVAGTNFKLCIEVFRIEAGDDVEVRQFAQTLVFRSLKKEFTLKSWEETENCDE
jgi:parvulin-like peptidyl-prolyl isomerase